MIKTHIVRLPLPSVEGKAEAKLISMRRCKPPKGFGKRVLRMLAAQLVRLQIDEARAKLVWLNPPK